MQVFNSVDAGKTASWKELSDRKAKIRAEELESLKEDAAAREIHGNLSHSDEGNCVPELDEDFVLNVIEDAVDHPELPEVSDYGDCPDLPEAVEDTDHPELPEVSDDAGCPELPEAAEDNFLTKKVKQKK